MKTFFLLSVMMSLGMSISATPMDNAVKFNDTSDLKHKADKLRFELKRESDERKNEASTPVHVQHQLALMEEYTYKERLDSIVSVGDYKQEFTYNDRGEITTRQQLRWSNDAWVPQWLEEREYDDKGLVSLYIRYAYQETGYVPQEALYNSYHDEAKNQVITGYATWDAEHQDWRFQYVGVSELDEQGREVAYTYYWGWDDAAWQPTNAYERYEIAYLDDEVKETTWYDIRDNEPVPSRKRKEKIDEEHHYTVMYENFTYRDGKWLPREYNEERRWYYGDQEWAYKTLYHEYKSAGYSGEYDYGNKSEYEYDDHMIESLQVHHDWDPVKKQWKGTYLREHVNRYYSTDWGYTSQTLLDIQLDGWNDAYDTWSWGVLMESDYDQNREWIYNAQATWSPEAKDWVYSFKEKIDRIFDDQGRLTLQEQMTWNTETQEWKHPFISTSYEYADDGLVTMTQWENWDSAAKQWQTGRQTLTRKDERNSIVYEDSSNWDVSEQRFVPSFRAEIAYIYDDENMVGYMYEGRAEIFRAEYSNWDVELDTWSYGRKTESEYDDKYRIIHRLTSYWIPNAKEFYLAEELQQEFDDESGEMIEYQIDTYSEDGNKDFEYHDKWSKRCDAHNNVLESCTYAYNLEKGEFWMATRSKYEYDLTTPAYEVMGLYSNDYYKDKPLSYLYQEFDPSGNEVKREERYFYYSEVEAGGEGIGQITAPVMVNVVDGKLTFSSESLADLTICSLDGKLIDSAKQVRNYSLQLTVGMYLVTVNGVSRMLKI